MFYLVVFLDVFHRSFSRIEQFNAAYKRQKKTGFDHISQRYLYMHYTDAHIRAWMNTTITRIYGSGEQRQQSLRKSTERLSTRNTRALVGQFQSPHLAVHLSMGIKLFMNYYQVVLPKRTCGVFWQQRWILRAVSRSNLEDNKKQLLNANFYVHGLKKIKKSEYFLNVNRDMKIKRFWTQNILSHHWCFQESLVHFHVKNNGRDMSNLMTWAKRRYIYYFSAKLHNSGPLLIIHQTSWLVCSFVIHCRATNHMHLQKWPWIVFFSVAAPISLSCAYHCHAT